MMESHHRGESVSGASSNENHELRNLQALADLLAVTFLRGVWDSQPLRISDTELKLDAASLQDPDTCAQDDVQDGLSKPEALSDSMLERRYICSKLAVNPSGGLSVAQEITEQFK